MDLEAVPMSVKLVLHDRDAGFTAASGAVFQAACHQAMFMNHTSGAVASPDGPAAHAGSYPSSVP